MRLAGKSVVHSYANCDTMDSRKVRDSWCLLPCNNEAIFKSGAVRLQAISESAAQEIETSLRRRLAHG